MRRRVLLLGWWVLLLRRWILVLGWSVLLPLRRLWRLLLLRVPIERMEGHSLRHRRRELLWVVHCVVLCRLQRTEEAELLDEIDGLAAGHLRHLRVAFAL